MNLIGKILFSLSLCFALCGCAYHFGYAQRSLPGGYQKVSIPVFKNMTNEVGIETYFTNALIRQFARSQVAEVSSKEEAPVHLVGRITKINYERGGLVEAKTDDNVETHLLPQNAVQASEYRMYITVEIELKRVFDQTVLWRGNFKDERGYTAPQVGKSIVNSVNPLYNKSARREVAEQLAYDMMTDAHDRITENF